MMRQVLTCAPVLALAFFTTIATPTHASTTLRLAVRVSSPGIVGISDTQLAANGWQLPLPRSHVTLLYRNQVLPLSDTGFGFAFVGLPNESRWSHEAVYWLSIGETDAPRAPLPNRLPTPVIWDPDRFYDRHQTTSRGDSWWAGELRGSQTISATIALPEAIPANTALQLRLRGNQAGNHAVSIAVDNQAVGSVSWNDPPAGAQLVAPILNLPSHAAGAMRIDLKLASEGDTILLDDLTLPSVFPAAIALSDRQLAPALELPTDASGADVLIITHSSFRSALDPLIAAHARLGRRAAVADVQAVYDAYSAGERDPEAIRRFVRQAQPHAVLLVGAGTVALRQETPARPTFLPPYLLNDAEAGETACDTCYTRLGSGSPAEQFVPDIPIGRFPVTTLAEAQTIVAKTVAYLTAQPAGAWQSRVVALADNDFEPNGEPDPAGSFTQTAEVGLSALPRGLNVTRLYYAPNLETTSGPFEPNVARLRCQLFRALDGGRASDRACPQVNAAQAGAAVWLYVGHGSPWQWATTEPSAPAPYLWYLYDADSRRNGNRLPILFSMTCLSGDFANPTLQSNDERLVLQPGGGVIASLGSAGEGVNTGHRRLLQGALTQLYGSAGNRTLGAAHLAGLQALDGTPDLAFSFAILGDPLVAVPFVPTSMLAIPMVTQ